MSMEWRFLFRRVVNVLFLAALVAVVAFGADTGSGKLKLSVEPGRAGVFVDGKYLGPAANFGHARTYAVAAGEHELKLVEPRYEDVTQKITITSGKTMKVESKMKPLPLAKPPFGSIKIVGVEKFSAVYLNDHYYGHAGEFNNAGQALLIQPGDYKVRVVPASGAPHEESIKVEANKTTVVHCK